MNEPRQLAGCVITNDLGEVLLLHRNRPREVQWELPGGKLDKSKVLNQGYESHKDAAARETREELGVEVAIQRALGGTIFGRNGIYWEYTWFLARITSGEPRVCEPDMHDDLGYYDLRKPLEQLPVLSPNVIDLANDIQSGRVHI